MSAEDQRGSAADGPLGDQPAPEHLTAELAGVGSGGRPVSLQIALDLHVVNLLRLKKALGVSEVDAAAKKKIKQILIDMAAITEARQDIDGLRK